jgi:hypothetical protein
MDTFTGRYDIDLKKVLITLFGNMRNVCQLTFIVFKYVTMAVPLPLLAFRSYPLVAVNDRSPLMCMVVT